MIHSGGKLDSVMPCTGQETHFPGLFVVYRWISRIGAQLHHVSLFDHHQRSFYMTKVNNINGTSANICKCTSWLQHWVNYSGRTLPTYCGETTCTKAPEVGAHVQKDGSTDRSWYIVPLCKTHNSSMGTLDVTLDLVSANVANTCGKST